MKWLNTKKTVYLIVLMALAIRLFGLNFDQGQHLHPDERFLTIVVSTIHLPSNLTDYFSQDHSPLNPYNHGFNFYVYGNFPLLITRLIAEAVHWVDYDHIFMVGRVLSAGFDSLTVLVVYHLAQLIFKNKRIPICSAFFYALAVLPIQQAHFFTVDSFTVFFATLTLFLTIRYLRFKRTSDLILGGFAFGLTLANKTSLVIALPVLGTVLLFLPLKNFARELSKRFFSLSLFIICCLLAFRLFQPYAFDGLFSLSSHFVGNINQIRQMTTGEIDYPPNLQWAYTLPFLHPLVNIFLWGLGPMLALLAFGGMIIAVLKEKYRKDPSIIILLVYILIIFLYQGVQLAKYLRYFYPIYPVLAVFAGFSAVWMIELTVKKRPQLGQLINLLIVVTVAIWPIAFLAIYNRPHSRVTASEWIYQNIPAGSRLTSEIWDDSLPLRLQKYQDITYENIPLALYDVESNAKWKTIVSQLNTADYIILSSNRLYGSIPKMPQRYPVGALFYQLLFAEKLGFKKVAEISSYPSLFGLPVRDESAEESFTVYDHPTVVIFRKTNFDSSLLQPLLNQNLINSAHYINPASTTILSLPKIRL